MYLIWSNEHEAWWKPASMGYTKDILDAGRYSRDEALDICADACRYQAPYSIPNEVPIRAEDVNYLVAPEEKA